MIFNKLKNMNFYARRSKSITYNFISERYDENKKNINSLYGSQLDNYYNQILKNKKEDLSIPADKGYYSKNFKDNLLDQLIDHTKKNFPPSFIKMNVNKKSKDNTLMSYDLNFKDSNNKIFLDFIFKKEILPTVAGYLKSVPILFNASIRFSPNKRDGLIGSQYLHFDREDLRQIKLFVLLEDIDDECGPTCFLDSSESKQYISEKFEYKNFNLKSRIKDEELPEQYLNNINKVTGKMGTVYFLDTTNCLHFGSRQAKKSRYILMYHFLSPYSWKFSNLKLNINSNYQDLILSKILN